MSRILVVEDALEIQEIVKRCLAGDPYRVATAGSCGEAELKLAHQKFDLVLLDVGLLDGDGFSLCAKIRSDARDPDVPVIFLMAKSEIEQKVLGFSVGGDDYLTKPFHPQELKVRVATALRKHGKIHQTSPVIRRGSLRLELVAQRAFAVGGDEDRLLDLAGC